MKNFLYEVMINRKKGWGPSTVKLFLAILAGFYGVAVRWIIEFYRYGILSSRRLAIPVISIGNITAGGTGKTPLVAALTNLMKAQGKKPVILTRGYMGSASSYKSDEALMLGELAPGVDVAVGKNRFIVGSDYLKKQSADVFFLDDGFQHWKLKRDLDIVVIDTTDPWGNGWLLPRGLLREPLTSLQRCDVIVLTKIDPLRKNVLSIYETLKHYAPQVPVVETAYEPIGVIDLSTGQRQPLTCLEGKKITAVSAIGNPEVFIRTLSSLAATIAVDKRFLDHHAYLLEDVRGIEESARQNRCDAVLTTHKDAVKLRELIRSSNAGLSWYYLAMDIKFLNGKEILLERINGL